MSHRADSSGARVKFYVARASEQMPRARCRWVRVAAWCERRRAPLEARKIGGVVRCSRGKSGNEGIAFQTRSITSWLPKGVPQRLEKIQRVEAVSGAQGSLKHDRSSVLTHHPGWLMIIIKSRPTDPTPVEILLDRNRELCRETTFLYAVWPVVHLAQYEQLISGG